MHGGSLHREDGTARVFDKLVQHRLGIVILTVCQSGKGAYTDEVAVAAHHGDGLQQMLTLVTVHDDTTLRLQFPGTGIDIEHDDIHT